MRMGRPRMEMGMLVGRPFAQSVLLPARFRDFDPADRRDHLRQPDAYLAVRSH